MNYLKSVLLLVFFAFGKPSFAQVNSTFEEVVDFSIPKNIYFTGEKIWLAVNVNSASRPSPSRVVYAELWNRYGESVALAKLPLQEGEGFNFLQIPDDLASDHYLLRVFTRVSPYTNLEKGLVQEFVTVFNPRIPPEVVAERRSFPDQQEVSNLISLSKSTVQPGEPIEISYMGIDSLLELTVAVPNPFLETQGKISSNDLYENLASKTLVPEFFGHIIEARIEPGALDSLGTGLFYLSLHGKKSVLFTDEPDEDGSLFFDAGGLRNWDFMVAQGGQNQNMNGFEIVTPSPKTIFKSGFQFPALQISPADQLLLSELLRGSQIEGYFVQEFQNEPIPVVTGFVQDRTFVLDDYNRFENVETHLKEYVPEVTVRTRDKSKELRVLNALQNRSFTEDPLLLVDAMPIFDLEMLLEFNPAKFEKMEILTRRFFLNEEVYSGVISFSSFLNDFGGFPLPANAVYLPYSGILPPVTDRKTLFQPVTEIGNMADWRTILYWSPATEAQIPTKSIAIDAPILKGSFQVVVKTVDSDGKVNVEYQQFEVGKN
ncbi:hypothetical protein [Algoriphagus sp. A40]|uniref:hypothetical protein n=1 Tax=Algoriphagus sp. A40 TaxID=1945863 RepID=UPI0009853949|nr:hypothetical protein [Algoriphagus sp. A40]OOG72304.1 hypothetical protein B0E43_15505 [Algoriphagus sp. A40]